jgi:hypothetical protein
MIITVLSFQGCPNVATTIQRIQTALKLENMDAQIDYHEVDTPEKAVARQFLGSPSVRVNDRDIEERIQSDQSYGLMCRTYRSKDRIESAPPINMIRAALRRERRVSAPSPGFTPAL